MARPERDLGELKEALIRHSVVGYPVEAPYFGVSRIIRQGATAPVAVYNVDTKTRTRGLPMVYYVVGPVAPPPFPVWAEKRGKSKVPMTLAEWEKKYSTRGQPLPVLHEILERLEKGEPVSEWEAEYEDLMNRECLDDDKRVVCYTFSAGQLPIPKGLLKPGMLVEFREDLRESGGWPGKIVGIEDGGKVALLELFTPTPYMEMPDAVANEAIRKGFYASRTYALGYGLKQAMEDQNMELPPGGLSDDEKEWILSEFLDMSVIEDFCKANYPDDPHCMFHGMLVYILPVWTNKGVFLPLPENVIPDEYVVSYEE